MHSLSGGLCRLEQGNGEPEGAALAHFGHGAQQTPQHRHLLGADAQAQACATPCSGSLHVILCPLCTRAAHAANPDLRQIACIKPCIKPYHSQVHRPKLGLHQVA